MRRWKQSVCKPYAWAITFTIIVTLCTGYVLLDAFVIPRVYVVVSEDEETKDYNTLGQESVADSTINEEQTTDDSDSNETANEDTSKEVIQTEDYYSDEEITIQITTDRTKDTTLYVADIVLCDPYALKTAFAKDTYGRNVTEKTSRIADGKDAILAINGDYYGVREGYVIRNGVLYREKSAGDNQEDLVIYEDGSFEVIKEGDVSASELLENGAWQVLSFGPALVLSSEIAVSIDQEVDQAMTSNPRTAIGMIDDLHYVMVVADGRTSKSEGLSLYELAAFMQDELGCEIAYNLDGGGSSTMYFCGEVINEPTTGGRKISERSVSDIVYIGE